MLWSHHRSRRLLQLRRIIIVKARKLTLDMSLLQGFNHASYFLRDRDKLQPHPLNPLFIITNSSRSDTYTRPLLSPTKTLRIIILSHLPLLIRSLLCRLIHLVLLFRLSGNEMHNRSKDRGNCSIPKVLIPISPNTNTNTMLPNKNNNIIQFLRIPYPRLLPPFRLHRIRHLKESPSIFILDPFLVLVLVLALIL